MAGCAIGCLLLSGCGGGPSRDGASGRRPPPTGVFYYRDPADASAVLVTGWDGRVRGRLPLPAAASSWQQSPDGAYLLVPTGGDELTVLSLDGRPALRIAAGATWADDSRHLCVIADLNGRFPKGVVASTGPGTTLSSFPPTFVYIDSVDGDSRRVASAPRFSAVSDSQAFCSIGLDRVVIVSTALGLTQVAAVLELSTGHRLRFGAASSASVAVSPDDRYVAESNALGTVTTVRDTVTGRVTGQLGRGEVRALSASGRLAVRQHPGAAGPPGSASTPAVVDVVDVATGRGLWSATGYLGDLVVEPAGSRFVIGMLPAGSALEDVWLVDADGTATRLATRVRPAGG